MDNVLNYLYGLNRFGIKPGLEIIRKLLAALDNPQDKFKSVHIAGTNGKGSTSAFLDSILRKAGYKVGLYTSPHLIRFNERIRVNGKEISDTEIIELVKEIKVAAEREEIETTFFEFTTAMAFLYFMRKGINIAVIETGLGGRLDATNVLSPEVSIITSIALDHQKFLGETVEEIAREKAGIIKGDTVIGENEEKVIAIFKEYADYTDYTDKTYLVNDLAIEIVESDMKKQKFKVADKEYEISLLGKHQISNAGNAILAVDVLRKKDWEISDEQLKLGLFSARWSGRLQVISQRPFVIIDGAHNVQGMTKLREFVQGLEDNKKNLLVLAFSEDKEYQKMIELIVPLFKKVIVTTGNFKPLETKVIAQEVRKYCYDVEEIPEVAEVMKKVEDGTLITGSLYLIGDVLGWLEKNQNSFSK